MVEKKAKKKIKKKVKKKKVVEQRMVKEHGVMVKAKSSKKPVITQYFYPPDGRTQFYKPYMKLGAEVEIVEQFGSHETRKKYAIRNLIKVRFVGQKQTDLVSPACIKRRLREEDK